jgi:hypothetical protein
LAELDCPIINNTAVSYVCVGQVTSFFEGNDVSLPNSSWLP